MPVSNVLQGFPIARIYGLKENGTAVLNVALLPTQHTESSELYALDERFKVRLPLPISGRV